MPTSRHINDSIMARLKIRAKQLNMSVEDLLNEWLDIVPDNQPNSFHQQVVNAVEQSIVVTDLNGIIIEWNSHAEQLYGWREDEAIGKDLIELTSSDMSPAQYHQVIEALSNGQVSSGEFQITRRDGRLATVFVVNHPIMVRNKLHAITSIAVDIANRALAEERPRVNEARFRAIAENFPNGTVSLYDHDLRFIVSRGERSVLNVIDLDGKRLRDFFPPEVYERDEPALIAALQGQRTESIIKYQGRHYRVITLPIYDDNGEVINGMVMSQDITELKETELALRDANYQLELGIDTANLGIWQLDIESNELTWNSKLYEIYGLTPEAFAQNVDAWRESVHPDDREEANKQFDEISNLGYVDDVHFRVIRPNGDIRHITASGRTIYDAAGNKVKFMGINLDLTDLELMKNDLYENEAYLKALVETQSVYMIRTDANGQYSYVNNKFFRDFASDKYDTPADVIGVNGLVFIVPADHALTAQVVQKCMENPGQSFQVTVRKPHVKRGIVSVLWEFVALVDEANNIYEIQCIGIDISAQKLTEERLLKSQTNLETILNSTTEYVWSAQVKDGQLEYQYHSPVVEQLTGYPANHFLVYGAWQEIIHPNDVKKSDLNFARELSGETVKHEYRIIRADGTVRWVQGHTAPTLDASGNVIRLDGVVSDITERKLAEQALQESQANLQKILNTITDYVWSARVFEDGNFEYLYYSPVVEKLTGYPPQYYLTGIDAWYNTIHPDDLEQIKASVQREFDGETVEHEYRIIRADGEIRWVLGTTTPTLDDTGYVVRLDGVVTDITKRKLAELAVRESESRYRTLFDGAVNPIIIYDPEARIVMLNDMAASNFGAPTDQIIGKLVADFFPDGHQLILERVQEVLATGDAIYVEDTPILNGEKRWIWSIMQPVPPSTGQSKLVQTISYDITDRQQAVEAQRRVEERYHAAIDASLDAFYLMESVYDENDDLHDFRIIEINDNAVTMLGLSRATLVGSLICELFPINREQGFFDLYKQVAETGEPLIQEFFVPEDGFATGWYRHQVVKVGDGIAIMTRNITDWKESEELLRDNERIKSQIQREQERNALAQRLISTLSHDLRTPLTIVATTHEILYRYYERFSEQQRQDKVETIDRQIQFAIHLLQDTVDVVRGSMGSQKLNRRWVNLASICRISLEEVETSYGESYKVEFINRGDVQMAWTDETLVSRILLNLVSNAFKYTSEGGTIQLILDQAHGWVKLMVVDTGMGMAEDDFPQIFESFYRTDQVGKIEGTGLGLSIVRECVHNLHGRVQVDSKLGAGSTFTVEFPLAIDIEFEGDE